MNDRRKIRTAISGLGRISWGYHIPALCENDGFELTAVSDPLQDRIEEVQYRFHVSRGFVSYENMLKEIRPELVIISSPTCFHVEQVLSAFRAGCDVICEKPLASSLAEALEIKKAMTEYKRKIMVYQPHRITGEALALKAILKAGILGEIFYVRRKTGNFVRRNDWQAFKANGGGMLNNYGSHYIDQFIYLFGGSFKKLGAVTKKVVGCGDAEDFVKISGVNVADICFDIEINMGDAFCGDEWIVCGKSGTARFQDGKWISKYFDAALLPPVNTQAGMAAEGRRYPSEPEIKWMNREFPAEQPHRGLFYDNVYDFIEKDASPLVPFDSTMELMDVIRQCRESSESEGCSLLNYYF